MAGSFPARTGSEAPALCFDATVLRIGDRTIIRLPAESARLPSRGQVAVTGRVGGVSFQSVVEPDGRRGHWLRAEASGDASLRAGKVLGVELTPTSLWPGAEIPNDFGAALLDALDVAALWTAITPMARWEWVRWISATKIPSSRERSIDVAISKLRSGKRRPCCFDLSACTDADLAKNGKLVDAE